MKKNIRRIFAVIMALSIVMMYSVTAFAAEGEHEHTWDQGTVTTEATCQTAGKMTYYCTECKTEKTEEIAVAEHNYVNGVCSVCQAVDAVAAIGDTEYPTFEAAIKAAADGDEIELLKDCSLPKDYSLNKNVNVKGNGKTLEISGQLSIKSGVISFDNTKINDTKAVFPALSMGTDADATGCGITLTNGSDMEFIGANCIYSGPNSVITVDNSTLGFTDGTGNSFMGGKSNAYIQVNVINGGKLISDNTAVNGLNWVHVTCTDSEMSITNAGRQGIVGGRIDLINSTADISGCPIGFTMYKYDYFKVDGTSAVTMNNCSENGFWMWGGQISIDAGGKLEAHNSGADNDLDADYYPHCPGQCAFIANTNYYSISDARYSAKINFADGALVDISNNNNRAITNHGGDVYIGSTTVMTNNGNAAVYGGAIYNDNNVYYNGEIKATMNGSVTIASGAKVYNNHASKAGDDIYNEESGKITVPKVGSGWKLDDCNHTITGWYFDNEVPVAATAVPFAANTPLRWNVGSCNGNSKEYYEEFTDTGKETAGVLSLKAAHGEIVTPPPVTPVEPEGVYTVTYWDGIDANGGNGTVIQSTGDLKEGVDTPACADPVREGYEFTGWTPVVEKTVTGNANYVATWKPAEDKPEVDPNGGSDVIDDDDDINSDPMGKPDPVEDDTDASAQGVKTGDSTAMIPLALGFGTAIMLLAGAVALRRREN